jgi:putative nucleotidyltransferase with HDIG domain
MTALALAQEVQSLLSLPEAVLRLNALLDDPGSTDADLAEVIGLDPGLTASLLKLVNSAYYNFPQKVTSIPRAVGLIGRGAVRSLAVLSGMAEVFKGIPPGVVDMETFWLNSVMCGALAKLLAQRARCDPEPLFIAGLLHAIGRLVFYLRRPEQYRRVLAWCDTPSEAQLNAGEREVFGFDHAELGAELCRQWRLPESLGLIIRHHLAPLAAPERIKETAVLHVAVDMAAGIMPSTQAERYATDYSPGFDPAAWRELGLAEEAIPELLQAASLQGLAILKTINPDAALIV